MIRCFGCDKAYDTVGTYLGLEEPLTLHNGRPYCNDCLKIELATQRAKKKQLQDALDRRVETNQKLKPQPAPEPTARPRRKIRLED